MTNCLNCGQPLGCPCQERVATNGKKCCSKCLQAYELKLQQEKEKAKQQTQNIENHSG